MVDAIVEAGLRVLREEGHAKLTTKRISERAGVSIGSLYQYFADKDEVIAAVYDRQHEEFWKTAEGWIPRVAERPLADGVRLIVLAGINRHRELFELHPVFYRDRAVLQTLATFNPSGGDRATAWTAAILERHRSELAVEDPERAAYLVIRALAGVLMATLRERPTYLTDPRFADELVAMFLGLLERRPAT